MVKLCKEVVVYGFGQPRNGTSAAGYHYYSVSAHCPAVCRSKLPPCRQPMRPGRDCGRRAQSGRWPPF